MKYSFGSIISLKKRAKIDEQNGWKADFRHWQYEDALIFSILATLWCVELWELKSAFLKVAKVKKMF